MRLLPLVLFLLTSTFSLANDGVFYAAGDRLVPLKETSIELKKEVLTLTQKGDSMAVKVYFEFFNPDDTRTLTVGFVTPPASGGVDEEEAKHPHINDFQTIVNNKNYTHQVKRMEETQFSSPSNTQTYGHDFVFYFDLPFQKGLNIVEHQYVYKGAASQVEDFRFDYRLTTGKSWANGKIDDFELNIFMEAGTYFVVNNSFQKDQMPAKWKVEGRGRVARNAYTSSYSTLKHIRPVKLNAGHLQLKQENFSPDFDLEIIQFAPRIQLSHWTPNDEANLFAFIGELDMIPDGFIAEELEGYTDKQLWLFRNYLFAKYGYIFKNPKLSALFRKFNWYTPRANRLDYKKYFSPKDQQLLEWIKAEETKRE